MFAINPDHPDVATIRKYIKVSHFKKGEIVLRPYDDAANLHSISSGLIKVYDINSRGEENISVMYGPGDIFPLSWIMGQRAQPVYFQALSDCEVMLIPQDIFSQYMKDRADVTYAVLQKVVEQFALYAAIINNLEFKFARERLAYRLLLLAGKFGEKKKGALSIPYISQQDLGATVNLSREGVSREMTRFERLGIVTYGSSGIVIKDSKRLHKELGEDASVIFFDAQKK